MRTTVFLLIVCSVFAASFSAETIIPADPKNPGKCIYDGKELAEGKNDFQDQCIAVFCNVDRSMIHQTCSPISVDGCKSGDLVDVSQPFPHCCKQKFICKDKEGNEIVKEISPYSD